MYVATSPGDRRVHTGEVARRAPAHRLALGVGAEGPAGGDEHDGFEQVGLALRVAAREDDEAARRRQVEREVVAEVGQAQPLDVHAGLLSSDCVRMDEQTVINWPQWAMAEVPIMNTLSSSRVRYS